MLPPHKSSPAKSQQLSEPSPAAETSSQLKGHLLVAEDNRVNRIYIVELLKMLGCTCDVAESGVEVLSALQRSPYDLILMDCHMPEMDGYTAAREIRQREASASVARRIPIVALTASALEEDRELCLKAGMDNYLEKPVDFEHLRATLAQYLAPSPPSKPASGGTL